MLLLIPFGVHGQALSGTVDNTGRNVSIFDASGRPLINPDVETEGSPLFIAKWKLGWIRLADSSLFAGVPLELDLEKQTVRYKRSDGVEIGVEQGKVRSIAIMDTVAGQLVSYQFSCGFPPIDNQSATSFYLQLDSGKICLLESLRKRFYQEKKYTGESSQEYRLYDEYYVYYKGKMIGVRKDTKFFLALTNDKHDQMEAYLKNNKSSLRSVDDIWQFIHYYNGLP